METSHPSLDDPPLTGVSGFDAIVGTAIIKKMVDYVNSLKFDMLCMVDTLKHEGILTDEDIKAGRQRVLARLQHAKMGTIPQEYRTTDDTVPVSSSSTCGGEHCTCTDE